MLWICPGKSLRGHLLSSPSTSTSGATGFGAPTMTGGNGSSGQLTLAARNASYPLGRALVSHVQMLVLPPWSATAKNGAGNFLRDEASDFLRGFADVLSPGDTMLVGLDSCMDPAKV